MHAFAGETPRQWQGFLAAAFGMFTSSGSKSQYPIAFVRWLYLLHDQNGRLEQGDLSDMQLVIPNA